MWEDKWIGNITCCLWFSSSLFISYLKVLGSGDMRCYFPLFTEGSNIQSVQLALTDWEYRCSGLFSAQALRVLLMSWAAIALCSLSWAGVLSPFVTSSSVNPQLMSLFPALKFFLLALQQVTAERVSDKSQQDWFGEVKAWSCESGSISGKSCRRGSENRLMINRQMPVQDSLC